MPRKVVIIGLVFVLSAHVLIQLYHFHEQYLYCCVLHYTRVTSKCRIQLELETSLGKALIEGNSCSIVEINNAA